MGANIVGRTLLGNGSLELLFDDGSISTVLPTVATRAISSANGSDSPIVTTLLKNLIAPFTALGGFNNGALFFQNTTDVVVTWTISVQLVNTVIQPVTLTQPAGNATTQQYLINGTQATTPSGTAPTFTKGTAALLESLLASGLNFSIAYSATSPTLGKVILELVQN